jgi:hypothetical protein
MARERSLACRFLLFIPRAKSKMNGLVPLFLQTRERGFGGTQGLKFDQSHIAPAPGFVAHSRIII